MNRRELFGQAAAALFLAETPRRKDAETSSHPVQPPSRPVVQTPRRPAAEPPKPPAAEPPGQADRLFDPTVVQERAPATEADNDPAIKALEHRLKCTCGCNLDIYTCRTTDFTCTYSPALHQEVLALRKAGNSDDDVIEAFVAKYGESILMAPKPRGFNLAGYLVPGVLVASIALVLAWVLIRRGRVLEAEPPSRRAAEPPAVDAEPPSRRDAEERLQRALEEVED